MFNNCLLLTTSYLNDAVYEKYITLKNMTIYDVYILCDTSRKEVTNEVYLNDEHIILYNGNEIYPQFNSIPNQKPYIGTVQFIVLWFYLNHNNGYDNYWFMEDDILLEGNKYLDFFTLTDKIECDLLVYKLNKSDDLEDENEWFWNRYFDTNIYKLKSFLQLYRINKSGLECLKTYDKNLHVHSEAIIPSLISNNGLSIKELSKETHYTYNIKHKQNEEWYENRNHDEWYHPIKSKQYVVICTIIKDEHEYLDEWIQYNLSLGFDEIYLYEDYGSKSHQDITSKYKNVHLRSIEGLEVEKFVQNKSGSYRQLGLFRWFCKEMHGKVDWCAFIDIDEFIMFDEGYDLNKLLTEHSNDNCFYLFWKQMNANGHINKPNGSTIDNYTTQVKLTNGDDGWGFKSIVNMRKPTIEWRNNHECIGGCITKKHLKTTRVRCYEKAWINHYFTKSWEDWCYRIFVRGDVFKNHRKLFHFFKYNEDLRSKQGEMMKLIGEYKKTYTQ